MGLCISKSGSQYDTGAINQYDAQLNNQNNKMDFQPSEDPNTKKLSHYKKDFDPEPKVIFDDQTNRDLSRSADQIRFDHFANAISEIGGNANTFLRPNKEVAGICLGLTLSLLKGELESENLNFEDYLPSKTTGTKAQERNLLLTDILNKVGDRGTNAGACIAGEMGLEYTNSSSQIHLDPQTLISELTQQSVEKYKAESRGEPTDELDLSPKAFLLEQQIRCTDGRSANASHAIGVIYDPASEEMKVFDSNRGYTSFDAHEDNEELQETLMRRNKDVKNLKVTSVLAREVTLSQPEASPYADVLDRFLGAAEFSPLFSPRQKPSDTPDAEEKTDNNDVI